MTAIDIRDYAPGDGPALLGLVRELQVAEGAVYDRMKPPSEIGDWYIEGLVEGCRTRKGRILVATEGEVLLGYAVILTKVTSEDEVDEIDYTYAYVQDLAVAEPARGRGIGTQLLARCEAIARQAGVKWLRITVLSANEPAVGAYRKAGFGSLYTEMEKPL